MTLHLEDRHLVVADIDDTGIFARPADDLRAVGGQHAKPFLGTLVGTMFVPHGGKDAEFRQCRLAPDQFQDSLIFVGFEAVIGHKFGCNRNVVLQHAGISKKVHASAGWPSAAHGALHKDSDGRCNQKIAGMHHLQQRYFSAVRVL